MKRLVKKVRRIIIVFIILIIPISIFSIFLPMKNELEKSTIQNFVLISNSKLQTLEQYIERSIEGAESLSSRTAIRNKIVEYKENLISIDELKAFTLPKYIDGVNALGNVIYVARIVDNQILAEYGEESLKKNFELQGSDLHYELEIDNTYKRLMVYSPILEGDNILGFDIVNFDISNILKEINDERFQIEIQDQIRVERMIGNKYKNEYGENVTLISDEGYTTYIKPINGTNKFLIIRISQDILFQTVSRLTTMNLLAFVIGFIIIFLMINYVLVHNTEKIIIELEEVVNERTMKLKEANKDLQKNNKLLEGEIRSRIKAEVASVEKSQFLANMSHEIRTPMNGIMGFLEILYKTELSKEQKESVKAIKTSTDTLLTVIDDILDISKIEAGKIELEEITFNLVDTIESAIVPYAAKAKEKGLDINMMIRPKVPHFVVGDPTRLKQVITNLISNAIKFTNEGYIFLEAKLNNKKDDIYEIEFSVEDTGIGMKEEVMNRIFTAFTQADSSSTRKYGGTGLGLTISKSIVEMMRGKIEAESTVGKGSKFTFTVNLRKAKEAEKKERNPQEEAREIKINSKLKILLVEDNEVNKMLFVKLLENHGLTCDIAVNGKEAVKAVSENDYDIVFMDCQMPVMDGYEATRRIRKEEGNNKHTTIIAMTAYAMKGDAEKCFEAGMDGYLSKPIKMDKIMKIIDSNT